MADTVGGGWDLGWTVLYWDGCWLIWADAASWVEWWWGESQFGSGGLLKMKSRMDLVCGSYFRNNNFFYLYSNMKCDGVWILFSDPRSEICYRSEMWWSLKQIRWLVGQQGEYIWRRCCLVSRFGSGQSGSQTVGSVI